MTVATGDIYRRYRETGFVRSTPEPAGFLDFLDAGTPQRADLERSPELRAAAGIPEEALPNLPPEFPVIEALFSNPDERNRARVYVEGIEKAYYQNRGGLTLNELTMFEHSDFANLDPDTANVIRNAAELRNALLIQQKDMAEEAYIRAQRTFNQQTQGGLWHSLTSGVGNAIMGLATIGRWGGAEPEKQTFQEILEEQRALVREEFQAAVEQEREALNQGYSSHSATPGWLDGVMAGRPMPGLSPTSVGALNEAQRGAQFVGESLISAGRHWLGTALNWTSNGVLSVSSPAEYQRRQRAHDLQKEEQANQIRAAGDEALSTQLALASNLFWQQAPPEVQQQYLEIAQGDEMMAMSLFGGARLGGEGDDFIQMLADSIDEQNDIIIRELEEQDFSVGAEILETLAKYGKYVPGTLATGAALLLSDDDFTDDLTHLRLGEAYEQIAAHDQRPSSAFGIDGTFMGLATDIGMTWMFDPTMWLFAPGRGASALTQFSSATRARGWLRFSPVGRRVFSDAFEIVGRGAAANPRGYASALAEMPWPWRFQFGEAAAAGNRAAARTVFEEAMTYGGWLPRGWDRHAFAGWGGAIMRRTFGDHGLRPELVSRFATAQNTQTTLAMYGSDWYDNVVDWASRLTHGAGADDLFDDFIRGFDDIVRQNVGGNTAVRALEDQMQALADEVALYERIAEGNVRPIGEGMWSGLGGRSLDDEIRALDEQAALLGDTPDALRVGERANRLRHVGRRMDALPFADDELRMIDDVIATPEDDYVTRLVGAGDETSDRFSPLPRPGAEDGITYVPEDGRHTFSLTQDEQLQGYLTVHTDEAGKVTDAIIQTSDRVPGGGTRLWDEAARRIPELGDPATLARLAESVEVTADGARFIHRMIQRHARRVFGQRAARSWVANAQPELRRIQGELGQAMRLEPRVAVKQYVEGWLDEFVLRNENLRKIPDLITVDAKGVESVNWRLLRGQTPLGAEREITDATRRLLDEGRRAEENIMRQMLHTVNTPTTIDLPVSSLDLVMAESVVVKALKGQLTGEAFRGAVAEGLNTIAQTRVVQGTRQFMTAAHRFWVYDKVFRPATAMTVHGDEVSRIIHLDPHAMAQWAGDQAARWTSRLDDLAAKLSGRTDPSAVWASERLAGLREAIPRRLAAAERSLAERTGTGIRDLTVKDKEFLNAAQQWSNLWLQDDGFRAAMFGEEDFARWFQSPAASYLRGMSIPDLTQGVSRTLTQDEWFRAYRNTFDKVVVGSAKAARQDSVRAQWMRAIRRVQGGERAVELPVRTLKDLQTIPGWARENTGFQKLLPVNDFFDWMFLSPTNYRMGFIGRNARNLEIARLERMYESMGVQILDGQELADAALNLGMPASTHLNPFIGNYVDEQLLRAGYVTRNFLEARAEIAATRDIERMMYSWHLTSPLGKTSRVVAPFGKPWADMWGFWMREILKKPVLRGEWSNLDETSGFLKQWINRAMDSYPVGLLPNRGQALVSRLAATDFDLENQQIQIQGDEGFGAEFGTDRIVLRIPWMSNPGTRAAANLIGVGDEINIEGVDLGSLMFLPTAGDNPFMSVLPGLGVVPFALMDYFVPRPDEDAEGFQAAMQQFVPEVFPAFTYGDDSLVGRYLGGGWASFTLRTLSDFMFRSRHTFPFSTTSAFADVSTALNTNRQIKVDMSDPEFWSQIDSLVDVAAADVDGEDFTQGMIEAIVSEAIERSANASIQRSTLRQIFPANATTQNTFDDVAEVWVETGQRFPELVDERALADYQEDPEDPDKIQQFAASIRDAFYALDSTERDWLMHEYPGLNVQVIGQWTYNDARSAELGFEGLLPFRYPTGTSAAAQEEFRRLKDNGYIIPRDPTELVYLVIGNRFRVEERMLRQVYSEAAEWINANDPFRNIVVPDVDVDVDIRSGEVDVSIEDQPLEEPVGTDWRSNNLMDAFSQAFREWHFSTELGQISPTAAQLGLDQLGDDFTGEELISAIWERMAEVAQHPFYNPATDLHSLYLEQRSAARDNFIQSIRRLSPGEGTLPDQWYELERMIREEVALPEVSIDDDHVQEWVGLLREKYAVMAELYPGHQWQTAWGAYFARDYGPWPVDWEPPTPESRWPDMTNPSELRSSWRPYIHNVVDGDSLQVSDSGGQGYIEPALLNVGMAIPDQLGPFDLTSTPEGHEVRLLGVRAPEYSTDPAAAEEAHRDLFRRLQEAPPGSIWLVRDDRFGQVDNFGRELAWLWIDGEWYYDENALHPTDF